MKRTPHAAAINRQAQADFRARRKNKRNVRWVFRIELDGIGLDALQRWQDLTDAEIANPGKVREALTRAWRDAALNDPGRFRK